MWELDLAYLEKELIRYDGKLSKDWLFCLFIGVFFKKKKNFLSSFDMIKQL